MIETFKAGDLTGRVTVTLPGDFDAASDLLVRVTAADVDGSLWWRLEDSSDGEHFDLLTPVDGQYHGTVGGALPPSVLRVRDPRRHVRLVGEFRAGSWQDAPVVDYGSASQSVVEFAASLAQ